MATDTFRSGHAQADDDLEALRDRIDRLSWLMDSAILVPGLGMRVGLDSVLGLVPGVGDAASALISGYLINEARRAGLPKHLLVRMIGNVLVDASVGSVPVLGDLFDVAFKANRRNLALLDEHLRRQRRRNVPAGEPDIEIIPPRRFARQ